MKLELVIAIVNRGYSEVVMSECRKAGARGGTVLNGRGTASKEAVNFFGMEIEPEKELVLIAVPLEKKKAIMEAVNNSIEVFKKGQGICFSLPIDDVVGLKELDDENVEK